MSKPLEQLAILGGKPAFAEAQYVGRPNIGDRRLLLRRINAILDNRWLTNDGPFVRELEQKLAELVGVRHCIAVCNATIGLQIVIRAAGLLGEVIIPAMTFVATAHALQWQQVVPVFCDLDPKTHNIDPRRVEELITSRTSGIIGVHLWGRGCDIEALSEIAQRRRLVLLFDAAHAFACSHQGKMIGGFGKAEVFSFHATKFFNTFEGGAIATNDDDLAARIRRMRNFGIQSQDEVLDIGTNGKMNEVSAAMGLTSLDRLDEFIAANKRNYMQYQRELSDLPGVRMIAYDEQERCNYQYIVLEIDEGSCGLSRDQLAAVLRAENVFTKRYFYPGVHSLQPYRSAMPDAGPALPETERLVQRVLVLPTGSTIGERELNRICRLVEAAIANGPQIRAKLKSEIPIRDFEQPQAGH